MENLIKKADILVEALPYIRKFFGKTFVIKFGGKAMVEAAFKDSVVEDIALLKYIGVNTIVVHGGGPEISAAMEKLGKKPNFINGLRVTDKETMEIVEEVLFGKVNKEIVTLFNKHHGKAEGLSGKNGNLITAKQMSKELGFVGEVENIDLSILEKKKDYIHVIAPIGRGKDGHIYNINADDAASEIAITAKAEKLLLLTDVNGVLDSSKKLISSIHIGEVSKMVKDGTLTGGMIPKVTGAAEAVKKGVKKVHIINGNIRHSLLLEIFTDKGVGTEIV
ncbi:MAG: acetylglutamate kinase [Candidatus Firestonebacteria bacterium RIFOXYC2_FULL_39_67]|nr:MAG: acetylglutamate kinase [Candidatus Firestonebacteria bacterium RIFOXYD2_FULL_39_29]OGF55118.1 MAG: acetylglutamate kinase [Candidatus Firestonebacteria bacterium RIFOXYC2_FULL_39_67]OGF57826.1 MAG: acetylglutamate kinase [Candidatus Firestonebacteria bacterium RifOxyC12_full_39_7]